MVDLEKRIEDALKAYCSNKDSMHVPPRNTDIDVVLSDCLTTITDLKQQLSEAHKSRASWVEYSQKIESGEFVLVPREPTFAMTESGLMTLKKSESGYYIGSVEHIFKAMIEAVESGKFNSDLQAMNKDLSNGVISGENFDNVSDNQSNR